MTTLEQCCMTRFCLVESSSIQVLACHVIYSLSIYEKVLELVKLSTLSILSMLLYLTQSTSEDELTSQIITDLMHFPISPRNLSQEQPLTQAQPEVPRRARRKPPQLADLTVTLWPNHNPLITSHHSSLSSSCGRVGESEAGSNAIGCFVLQSSC